MVTFNYEKARWKATAIISKFGDVGTFVVKGNTGGFDDEGNVIAAQPDVTISGIVTPLLQYKTNEVDGTTIKSGDSYIFAFFSGEKAPIGSVININSDEFRIVDKYILSSLNGVDVYIKYQLRM